MKILALTDFSVPAEAGISLALDFIKEHNASVTIFHCLTEETNMDFQLGPEHSYQLTDISNSESPDWIHKWDEQAKELKKNIHLHISGGGLVHSVKAFCEKNTVDLIIMGSSGKSKSTYWGSNTEDIIKNIECPILIVKSPVTDATIKKVVFASGFTEKEKKSFLLFKDLIPIPADAEIHLLCIDKESFFSQPTPLIREVMSDFEHLAKPFKTHKHFYQDFNVKAGIRNFTDNLSPDLIVMSNKAKKKIKHLLLGNDVVNVAYESKYPVLLINYPD